MVIPKETKNTGNFPGERGQDHLIPHPPHPSTFLWIHNSEIKRIGNGFKFSKSKTQCVHFCQLRKQHDDPVLHLYGSPIPVVEES